MKKCGILALVALVLALFSGCATDQNAYVGYSPDRNITTPVKADATGWPVAVTNQETATMVKKTLDPNLLQPPVDLFTLGPGDVVELELLGKPLSRTTANIGLDGKIYYSLLNGVDVWGLTLPQAKTRLEEELSKYFSEPVVTITLKGVGSKSVWLLGRLSRPGIYPMTNTMTLLEGLSLAGGTAKSTGLYNTQDLGDLKHSFVVRQGKMLPVDFVALLREGDMSQNIYLKPDDFVFIPSTLSREVYVLGAVNAPRGLAYVDQMSIISAIAGVGGTIRDAYLSHVAIVRGSLTQPEMITVDYASISHGQAPNVLLEPGDIIYVPLTPYHILTDYADLVVTTFVHAWTANMGIRAVSGEQSIGVAVPVGR